jgi:hypothetical protein
MSFDWRQGAIQSNYAVSEAAVLEPYDYGNSQTPPAGNITEL